MVQCLWCAFTSLFCLFGNRGNRESIFPSQFPLSELAILTQVDILGSHGGNLWIFLRTNRTDFSFHIMKVSLFFTAAFSFSTLAASVDLQKRDASIMAMLTWLGGDAVGLEILNTGAEALRLLKVGTVLDHRATQKMALYQNGKNLHFNYVD